MFLQLIHLAEISVNQPQVVSSSINRSQSPPYECAGADLEREGGAAGVGTMSVFAIYPYNCLKVLLDQMMDVVFHLMLECCCVRAAL